MRARTRSKSSRDKVRAHRKRLRQQGLRPIQVWVPDMRSPAFVKEAHRQSLAVSNSPHAREDQKFIDAVSDRGGK
jgi:Protein  of unknown function (DUF3018)